MPTCRTFAFPKRARLKSRKAIDILFDRTLAVRTGGDVHSALFYPFRVIWNNKPYRADNYTGTRMFVSVPKKKIRHAVDRVTLRRRTREAWRLSAAINIISRPIDIGFVYIGAEVCDYIKINSAMTKIISKLQG